MPETRSQMKTLERGFEQEDRARVGTDRFRDHLACRIEDLTVDVGLHHPRKLLENPRHKESEPAIAVPLVDGWSVPPSDKCMRSARLGLPIQMLRSKSLRFLLETTWKQAALPCAAIVADQARKKCQMRYQRSP